MDNKSSIEDAYTIKQKYFHINIYFHSLCVVPEISVTIEALFSLRLQWKAKIGL